LVGLREEEEEEEGLKAEADLVSLAAAAEDEAPSFFV
jgi:hypothetical protein